MALMQSGQISAGDRADVDHVRSAVALAWGIAPFIRQIPHELTPFFGPMTVE